MIVCSRGGFHAGGILAAALTVTLVANAMTSIAHVSVTATAMGTFPVVTVMSIRGPVAASTSVLIVVIISVVISTVGWSTRRGLGELRRGLVQLGGCMGSGALVGNRGWRWKGPHGGLIRNGKLRTISARVQKTGNVVLLAEPAWNIAETKLLNHVELGGHFMLVQATYATQRQSRPYMVSGIQSIYLVERSHTRRDESNTSSTPSSSFRPALKELET